MVSGLIQLLINSSKCCTVSVGLFGSLLVVPRRRRRRGVGVQLKIMLSSSE